MKSVFPVFPSTVKTMKEGEEVAMRMRKAFLSMAVLAAGGLLAATAVMAADPPGPPQPECFANTFSAKAYGPFSVSCNESSTGQCTEIKYEISGSGFKSTDHAFAFEGIGVAYVKDENGNVCSDSPCNISTACTGGNLEDLGDYACHEQVVRVNANSSKSTVFTVGLVGQRSPGRTTLVVKKGKTTEACPILGIGFESAANPLATTTPELYEVLGGKCLVHVKTVAGKTTIVSATKVDPNGDYECTFSEPIPVGSVQVDVNDSGPRPVEFSEGFNFILGPGSCTYKQYYPPTGAIYKICY
jgi:hypothetical protein